MNTLDKPSVAMTTGGRMSTAAELPPRQGATSVAAASEKRANRHRHRPLPRPPHRALLAQNAAQQRTPRASGSRVATDGTSRLRRHDERQIHAGSGSKPKKTKETARAASTGRNGGYRGGERSRSNQKPRSPRRAPVDGHDLRAGAPSPDLSRVRTTACSPSSWGEELIHARHWLLRTFDEPEEQIQGARNARPTRLVFFLWGPTEAAAAVVLSSCREQHSLLAR